MKKFAALCMCILLAPSAAWAQTEQHQHSGLAPKDIGTVNFETSCSPAVKTQFNEAVALLHSFWFAESRAIFESVLKTDPNCAISYWGIALTHWGNPFAGHARDFARAVQGLRVLPAEVLLLRRAGT